MRISDWSSDVCSSDLWQGLSTARKQLEQQGDCAGAARVSAKQNELAKTLEREPQAEGLLRGKTRELGIDPKPERSIDNEITANLARERPRAIEMGIEEKRNGRTEERSVGREWYRTWQSR